jgi:hypothetical protein
MAPSMTPRNGKQTELTKITFLVHGRDRPYSLPSLTVPCW